MINSVNYSVFPADELFTFVRASLKLVDEKKSEVPSLVPFYDKANVHLVAYQAAMEREKKNPYTTVLAGKDGIRDGAFFAFRTFIEAAGYRQKEGWSAASSRIMEIIRRQGYSAAKLGYKAESAVLTNIVAEVREKCQAELTLTTATEWLDELDTAQLDFDTTFKQSIQAGSANEPTVWEVRPALVHSVKAVFSMIALIHANTPDPVLAELEASLNELIVRSLSTLKAAGTRNENQKKNAGPGDVETPQV